MRVSYDHEVDAIYISLASGPKEKQQKINEDVILDLDANGVIVGIEILDVTKNYGADILEFSLSLLNDAPRSDQYEYTAEEAAELLQVNKETLLRKIRGGHLKATRIGKAYRIPKSELHRLMTP